MQQRPTLIDDFIATSESGTRFRIYIWQLAPEGEVPGGKKARLATGELLNTIDDDTYEIAQTGVLISRER